MTWQWLQHLTCSEGPASHAPNLSQLLTGLAETLYAVTMKILLFCTIATIAPSLKQCRIPTSLHRENIQSWFKTGALRWEEWSFLRWWHRYFVSFVSPPPPLPSFFIHQDLTMNNDLKPPAFHLQCWDYGHIPPPPGVASPSALLTGKQKNACLRWCIQVWAGEYFYLQGSLVFYRGQRGQCFLMPREEELCNKSSWPLCFFFKAAWHAVCNNWPAPEINSYF